MAMSALRQSASGGIGKFILFGFLVLAAGGLVFSDVGGFFRGGVGSSDVAKIGDKKISIHEFDRTARRTLSQLGLSVEQAYQFGYLREILNNEVRGHLMSLAAKDSDINFSDKQIASHLETILSPMVQDGQNSKDVLKQLLQAQRMSEKQLVENINKDLSVDLLGQGIKGGFAKISNALSNDIAAVQSETRDVEYIVFKYDEFSQGGVEPTDEQLEQLYGATKEAYAIPESRKTQLITLNTDKLSETIEISEEEVRADYDDNMERYEHPETRSIEQAILQKEEDANKIAEALKSGAALKKAIEDVTGKTTDYIPANEVNENNLLDELAAPIFEAESAGPLGPVKSPLGYHVMVLSIEQPKTDSFEDVKDKILKELTNIRLSDARYELSDTLDDLLAGGASPEEIKQQLDVNIIDMPAFNRFGRTVQDKPAIKDMQDDKTHILETAFELGEGESSAVFETADGKMAALYLQSITDKSYQPFEGIKPTLKKRWIEDQRQADAKEAVNALFESLQNKETDFKSLANTQKKTPQTAKKINRNDAPPAPLTPESIGAVFSNAPGESFMLNIKDGIILGEVTGYNLPASDESKQAEITQSLIQASQNEGLSLFVEHQNRKFGAVINERLLEQAYAPSR